MRLILSRHSSPTNELGTVNRVTSNWNDTVVVQLKTSVRRLTMVEVLAGILARVRISEADQPLGSPGIADVTKPYTIDASGGLDSRYGDALPDAEKLEAETKQLLESLRVRRELEHMADEFEDMQADDEQIAYEFHPGNLSFVRVRTPEQGETVEPPVENNSEVQEVAPVTERVERNVTLSQDGADTQRPRGGGRTPK